MPAVPAGQGGGGCKKIPHQLRLAAALAWVAERAGGALQVQAPPAVGAGGQRGGCSGGAGGARGDQGGVGGWRAGRLRAVGSQGRGPTRLAGRVVLNHLNSVK